MSDFQYILTSAQLTKHYEVIQFLTQHPNEAYTLAQLDALLPHGVAVQRFPEEWFDLVEGGACWHRSIELHKPSVASASAFPPSVKEGDTDGAVGPRAAAALLETSAASALSSVARRAQYVLSCVKSEIRTLEDLRTRLESPSTLLDVEGCVALHTDQIVIAPELILRALRTGLVYYFPDAYDKNEFRHFGLRDATAASSTGADGVSNGGGGAGRAKAGQATAALLESFASQEERTQRRAGGGLGEGRDRTYIILPDGIRVQHQLLTRRGVPEQEDHSLPTKLYVGERLRLLFDNAVAVQKLHKPNTLQVQLSLDGVKPSKGERAASGMARLNALQTEPAPPLRIRKETQAVRHAPTSSATAPTAAAPPATGVAAPSIPMAPPASILVSATTKVEMEALYPCTFTLRLSVNGVENALAMEVVEETAPMPGVLILRDRQLDSFALAPQNMLRDALVNPPLDTHYPFESIDPTAASSQQSDAKLGAWAEFVPLPWTQNPSPVVLSLRDTSYPTQHATLQAATRAVFSAQSLADEARLRQTKERLRRDAERQDAAGEKRRRARYRGSMILSNRHLLHFGLDFSIPFACLPK